MGYGIVMVDVDPEKYLKIAEGHRSEIRRAAL